MKKKIELTVRYSYTVPPNNTVGEEDRFSLIKTVGFVPNPGEFWTYEDGLPTVSNKWLEMMVKEFPEITIIYDPQPGQGNRHFIKLDKEVKEE